MKRFIIKKKEYINMVLYASLIFQLVVVVINAQEKNYATNNRTKKNIKIINISFCRRRCLKTEYLH